MPRATQAIIGVNVVVFLLQLYTRNAGFEPLVLWPLGAGFAPWQLVTYAFLHANYLHIFFNMFGVFMFGSALEQFFGTRFYVTLYFVSVITAALTQLGVDALLSSPAPVYGASGGLFGLMLAFAVYFPQQRLMLIFVPVPIPARLFVLGYAVIELFFGVTGTQQGVAHFAHLGGMVGAFAMIQWRRGKPPFIKRRR